MNIPFSKRNFFYKILFVICPKRMYSISQVCKDSYNPGIDNNKGGNDFNKGFE